MKYSEFWRLDPLDTIEDIPNLSELKNELDSIVNDIRELIKEKEGKKGNIFDKYKSSLRIQRFKRKLENNGIALIGFTTFLRKELGVGINLSLMLIKLAFFTSNEIKIIDESIGFQKLIKGRTIPYNYKELMRKYSKGDLSMENFKQAWTNEKERISINV